MTDPAASPQPATPSDPPQASAPPSSSRSVWTSLGPRERWLVIGAALALMTVLVDRLLVHPWGQHLRQLRQETRTLERVVTKQQQFLDRKDYVLAEATYYKPFLRPAGPRDLEIASLLKELEAIGRQAEVSLGEVKPVPSEAAGPYQTYTFDIQYECTLPQWIQWTYLLESSPSLFTIDRATVGVKDKTARLLKGSIRITRLAATATAPLAAPAATEP